MASITLTWVPAGGANSLSQDVQFRISGASTWTTYQNVGPSVTTLRVDGLNDNVLYEFQIVDNCVYGGPVASAPATAVKITCPALGFTNTYDTVEYVFNHLGGNVDQYVIDLLDANSNLIATQTVSSMTPVISGSFSGLTPATTYQVRVTPSVAGISQACVATGTQTAPPPVCDAPTNVTAALS